MRNVQIKVIKITYDEALAQRYLTDGKDAGSCTFFEVGDTFLYQGGAQMPEGFCPWAWIDIYHSVNALATGSSYAPWQNAANKNIVCCTDGSRPVTFELKAL